MLNCLTVSTQPESPGVRCHSCTFHLNLPSSVGAGLYLPEIHHRSIPQLSRKQPELVAAVAVRSRLGAWQQPGAAQILRAQGIGQHIQHGQVEQSQCWLGMSDKDRTYEGLKSPNS